MLTLRSTEVVPGRQANVDQHPDQTGQFFVFCFASFLVFVRPTSGPPYDRLLSSAFCLDGFTVGYGLSKRPVGAQTRISTT